MITPVGYCLYLGQQQERERVLAWLRAGIGFDDSRLDTEYQRLIDDIQNERHCGSEQ